MARSESSVNSSTHSGSSSNAIGHCIHSSEASNRSNVNNVALFIVNNNNLRALSDGYGSEVTIRVFYPSSVRMVASSRNNNYNARKNMCNSIVY
jgi:hypothetical protein